MDHCQASARECRQAICSGYLFGYGRVISKGSRGEARPSCGSSTGSKEGLSGVVTGEGASSIPQTEPSFSLLSPDVSAETSGIDRRALVANTETSSDERTVPDEETLCITQSRYTDLHRAPSPEPLSHCRRNRA